MSQEKRNSSRIIILYIIALLLAASLFPIWQNTVDNWAYVGFRFKTDQDRVILDKVWPERPAEKAGLQSGDVLLSIGGVEIKSGRWFWDSVKNGSLVPGRATPIVFERQGVEMSTTITPLRLSDAYGSKVDEAVFFALLAILGLVILLRMPKSKTSVVLAFCVLSLATFYGDTYTPRSMLSWLDLVRLIVFQAALFYSPLLLHFVLIHPQRKGIVKKYKSVIPLVYAPWILFYAYSFVKQLYLFFFNSGQVKFWFAQIEPYSEPRIILRFLVALVFIGLVLHSFFKSRSTPQKHPATLMLIAVLCGLVPTIIIEFIQIFTAIAPYGSTASSVLLIVYKVLVAGVAVCFAWSVWVREKSNANSTPATNG